MSFEAGVPAQIVVEITTPGNVRNLNVFYAIRNDVQPTLMPDELYLQAVSTGLSAIYLPITNDMVTGASVVEYRSNKMVWDAVNQAWVVMSNYIGEPIGLDGQLVDDMLPQQCAAVITAECNKVRCRPKKFFPGFGETTQADGVLIALTIGHLVTAADAWLAPFSSIPYSMEWVTLANDGTIQTLNAATVNSILGTQRRRKIGVGM